MTDADVTEPASQHSDAEAPVPYRSGFVAVVGRPNVGKSTLINALIGTQIAIASSRPETTRKAIRGILTTDNAQIVLVDTPGIHRPRRRIAIRCRRDRLPAARRPGNRPRRQTHSEQAAF